MKYFLLILSISLVSLTFGQEPDDKTQILTTLNNYIDGFYKGDASKLEKALKPRLYKFGYWKNKETGEHEFYEFMSFEQAIAFVNKMKAEGRSRDENKIRNAEVLDMGSTIASAKVTAAWGIDYLLLSKEDGQWMIEQVIWEGPYETPTQDLKSTTTFYLIRHAEKHRANPSDKNPELTHAGHKRAKNWANVFKDIPLNAIYSTNYKRTLQTATPTAENKNIDIEIYNPNNMDINKFLANTRGKHVLIVGHSNTTPFFANALLGEMKYKDMDDTNNSGLYIVTVEGSSKSSVLLQID